MMHVMDSKKDIEIIFKTFGSYKKSSKELLLLYRHISEEGTNMSSPQGTAAVI